MQLDYVDNTNYSFAGFNLHLERIMIPFLLNVYLPSGVLVAGSWIGFFIPPELVPGRMALLVTILLMLMNFSADLSSQAPAIKMLTALDVWMIGKSLVPVFSTFKAVAHC